MRVRLNQVVASLLLTISAAACSKSSTGPSSPSSGPVTYQVTGTATHILVTYQDASGGTSQTGSALPFNYALTAKTGDLLYLSAQIDTNSDTGNITATISKNGSVIQNGSAAGFGSVITLSATY